MNINNQQRQLLGDLVTAGRLDTGIIASLDRSSSRESLNSLLSEPDVREQFEWLASHQSLFGASSLEKRWKARIGDECLDLIRQDYCGREAYRYVWNRGAGSLGCMRLDEALEAMEEKIRWFAMTQNAYLVPERITYDHHEK